MESRPLTPSAFWAEDVARNSPGLLASSLREARPHIPVSGTTVASLCGLSCEEKLGKQAQIRLGFAILHGMDESTEVQRGSVNCKWQPRISEKARLSLGSVLPRLGSFNPTASLSSESLLAKPSWVQRGEEGWSTFITLRSHAAGPSLRRHMVLRPIHVRRGPPSPYADPEGSA